MSEYASLVTTIFKGINFVVFIGFCSYFFYTKFLASLRQKIHEKQAILPKLEQERRGLHNQEANIDTAIEQQALIAKVLQKKIEVWATSQQNILHEQEAFYATLRVSLKKKLEQQNEYRSQKALHQMLIPEILATTQADDKNL